MEATGDGSSSWVPAAYLGDLDGVPSSWLWHDPIVVVVDVWRMNQKIKNLCLLSTLSPSL